MKKSNFLLEILLIPTFMFRMCTDDEKREMKVSGYSSSQIWDMHSLK